jgi:membrane-bound lytic murein transglycosylase D
MVTPPDTEFDLHLPGGTAAIFQEKIASIPESKRDSWRYHKVTPDDTLASIAHTYRVSVADLAGVNDLGETAKLDGVEALVVPVAPAAAPSAHTIYYTTRRGDTLVSVADRFGVSLTQLRRWNKLPAAGIKIEAGRRLHVAEPTLLRTSTRSKRGRGRTSEIASAEAPGHETAAPHHSPTKSHSAIRPSSHSSRSGHAVAATKSSSAKSTHASHPAKHPSHSKSTSQGQK